MATLTTSYQKIATGSSKTFGYATGYLELWAKYNSQDKASNTTNYSVQLRLVVSGGYIGNYQATNYSLSSTGLTTSSGNLGTGDFTSRTIATITGNVTHNSDGTKSISSSGSFNPTAWGISISVSGSATLPTIERESGVSASSPYIGNGVSISIDRKAPAFRETLSYKIGSLTGVIVEKTSNTVVVFNTSSIADQIYAQIPNAKEISGTITCDTYSGNTLIGTSTTNFKLYAEESVCKPDVDATIVDTNDRATALTGSNTKFIKYISKPKVTVNAIAKKSSWINGYVINLNDGQTQYVQEYTFPTIGSNSITVNATDSRNYSNPKTLPINIIDYVQLHINKIEISRPEELSSEAYLSLDGVWFNGNFSDTKPNTLTASYQYKSVNDEGWTEGGTLLPIINGNNFSIYNFLLGDTFDYETEYQFQIYFSDALMTVGSNKADVITLPKGQEIIAIGESEIWTNAHIQNTGRIYTTDGFDTHGTIWAGGNSYFDGDMTYKGAVMPQSENIMKRAITPNGDVGQSYNNTFYDYYNDYTNKPDMAGWGSYINFGTYYRNQLAIGNWTSGGKRVAVRSYVNEWTGWEYLQNQPVVLYENASGTNGTVTLNNYVQNFKEIEIFYVNGSHNFGFSSVKIPNANGRTAILDQLTPISSSQRVYMDSTIIYLADNTITVKDAFNWAFQSSPYVVGSGNVFYIKKVIGHQ